VAARADNLHNVIATVGMFLSTYVGDVEAVLNALPDDSDGRIMRESLLAHSAFYKTARFDSPPPAVPDLRDDHQLLFFGPNLIEICRGVGSGNMGVDCLECDFSVKLTVAPDACTVPPVSLSSLVTEGATASISEGVVVGVAEAVYLGLHDANSFHNKTFCAPNHLNNYYGASPFAICYTLEVGNQIVVPVDASGDSASGLNYAEWSLFSDFVPLSIPYHQLILGGSVSSSRWVLTGVWLDGASGRQFESVLYHNEQWICIPRDPHGLCDTGTKVLGSVISHLGPHHTPGALVYTRREPVVNHQQEEVDFHDMPLYLSGVFEGALPLYHGAPPVRIASAAPDPIIDDDIVHSSLATSVVEAFLGWPDVEHAKRMGRLMLTAADTCPRVLGFLAENAPFSSRRVCLVISHDQHLRDRAYQESLVAGVKDAPNAIIWGQEEPLVGRLHFLIEPLLIPPKHGLMTFQTIEDVHKDAMVFYGGLCRRLLRGEIVLCVDDLG
jgi:hypothetical protein